MNRLVVVASIACCALTAAACGSSSTAPKDTFAGTWVGTLEGTTITITATQNGSNFSGSGNAVDGSTDDTVTFSGTSTPPTISATLTVGSEAGYFYHGSYQSTTVVTGYLGLGTDSLPMTLNKQ
jgi:hypothetical protein